MDPNPRPVARLFQRLPDHKQSARPDGQLPGQSGEWHLEFERQDRQRADPLTGWAGSRDTRSQVKLKFPTREAAQAYAAREGVELKLIPTPRRTLKLQSYADNFK